MAEKNIITNLHPINDRSVVFPNVVADNIPSKAIGEDKLTDELAEKINSKSDDAELESFKDEVDASLEALGETINRNYDALESHIEEVEAVTDSLNISDVIL